MNRPVLCALLGAAALFTVPAGASPQDAVIKVDVLRTVGAIDRNLYGVFMEPIRNSMDGVLYDPEHPLANEDGFRTDYIEAAHELQLTNMRCPGGNYVASYDWKDGIGPKDRRSGIPSSPTPSRRSGSGCSEVRRRGRGISTA